MHFSTVRPKTLVRERMVRIRVGRQIELIFFRGFKGTLGYRLHYKDNKQPLTNFQDGYGTLGFVYDKTGQIISVAYEKWRTSCSSLIREIDIRLTSYQMENKQFQALGISQCKVEIFEEKQKQKTSRNLFTLSAKGDVPCVILESRKGICSEQSKTVLCFGAANTTGCVEWLIKGWQPSEISEHTQVMEC